MFIYIWSLRLIFFLMIRRPPISTLVPYTTHFRSSVPRITRSAGTPCRNGEESHHRDHRAHRETVKQRGARRLPPRSEEHTSELQSRQYLVCRLLLEKKKKTLDHTPSIHNHTRTSS